MSLKLVLVCSLTLSQSQFRMKEGQRGEGQREVLLWSGATINPTDPCYLMASPSPQHMYTLTAKQFIRKNFKS
ncbi:hypothetical protein QBC38DRAFT_462948 [Podospora fimiseda]|uniref:Secreted protein n=1 Tax=Podospora fimiseda TaxID=252190 RepID=A0AAN7BZI6_9PEZI|nr:hypothetical protein QBC38DRAFT_462948 [Podospora fimiseda]